MLIIKAILKCIFKGMIIYQNKRYLVFFLLLSFGASIFLIFKSNALNFIDERDYYQLAKNISLGIGYSINGSPTAFRPVGYPYFLSLLMSISDLVIFLKITNTLTYLFTILIYQKIILKYSKEVALYFVIFASTYPLFIYTSGILVPQSLQGMNLALIIYFVLKNDKNSTFIASLIYGLTLLVVPGFIFTLPVFVLYYVLFNKTFLKNRILLIIIFFIGTILTTTPWSYRNTKLFDQLVFISTNGGLNLLFGNSEHATSNTGAMTDISSYLNYNNKLNEAEVDKYYKHEAILWIQNNPYNALKLYFSKVLNHFNYINMLATKNQESKLKSIIAFITYYPILLLAFIRMLLYRKIPLSKLESLFYLIYIVNAFTSAIFFTRVRFRMPFDFLLITLASFGLYYLKNIFYEYRK